MKKDIEMISAELADIEEARLRGELYKEEAQQLAEQVLNGGVIPLPIVPDLSKTPINDPNCYIPNVIDFNYKGMTDEERIRRAVKDMEIIYASEEYPKMTPQIPRFVKAYLWNTPDYYNHWPES